MHWLTRIAIAKPWITFVIALALVGASIFGALQLQQELIPDIELPISTVIAFYPGATPDEIMHEVTEPIEAAVTNTSGLSRISSTSADNMCFIFLQFKYGTDMDRTNADLARQLESIPLPSGMPATMPGSDDQNPMLFPIDMNMMPLTVMSLKGDLEVVELRRIATDLVMPALAETDGVFSISLEGGHENVLIKPDPAKLNSQRISMALLATALGDTEFDSIEQLGSTLIKGTAQLNDIATISVGPPPGTAISRTDGINSIGIAVMKTPEANTVTTGNAVVAKVNELEPALQENNVELTTVFNQADYIQRSISDLTNSAAIGGSLAVIIILLFLAAIRGSLVIAISIPLSLLFAFFVMHMWGLTMNILTLSAMAIAIGRIVDDSIVMLEVIYRRLRQGEGFRQAALNGSREVARPIATATIATAAIFLPLAFVGGIVGELFVPFALTVTFALLASLLVSLTLVPALSSLLVPKKLKQESTNSWYHRLYIPVLKWALGHRALTCLIAVVLFVGSLGLIPIVGTSFMPPMAEKMIIIEIEMDLGTDINTTSAVAAEVEQVIAANSSQVQVYHTTVGTSSSIVGAMSAMAGGGSGDNRSVIEIMYKPDADLDKETNRLLAEIDKLGYGEAIKIEEMTSMMGDMDSNSFQVYVRGEDYAAVLAAAETLAADMRTIDGLTDVETDASLVLPKPVISIDQSRLTFHTTQGLDPALFQMEYAALMQGMDTQATYNGKQLKITGLLQNAQTAEELWSLIINGGLSYQLRLGQIADVALMETPTSIQRIDQQRAVTISATVTARDVGAVNAAAQHKLDTFSADGVELRMGGIAEEMEETFRNMGIAIIIAIAIAFTMVMLSFGSFINTLVIMVSLPLASIGAVLGLLITGHTIGASAMMGVLMLVGIVLTNGIVLISLVEQLRRSGVETKQALLEAGRTRLRPILMTALTTMIALTPLAAGLGQGVVLASELAIVVIGGLFASTLLTLIVIPVIYSLLVKFKRPPSTQPTKA